MVPFIFAGESVRSAGGGPIPAMGRLRMLCWWICGLMVTCSLLEVGESFPFTVPKITIGPSLCLWTVSFEAKLDLLLSLDWLGTGPLDFTRVRVN